MTRPTDELIAALVRESVGVKARSPWRLFLGWLAVSIVSAGLLLWHYALRPDLPLRLVAPGFLVEVGLLAAAALSAGYAAVLLSYPDRHHHSRLRLMPFVCLIALACLLLGEWAEGMGGPKPETTFQCTLCIMLFALVPAVWLLRLLKRQASTEQSRAGSMALLAAACNGCLAFRLSEPTDSVSHLALWHYLPLLAFWFVGGWLGRKFLRW